MRNLFYLSSLVLGLCCFTFTASAQHCQPNPNCKPSPQCKMKTQAAAQSSVQMVASLVSTPKCQPKPHCKPAEGATQSIEMAAVTPTVVQVSDRASTVGATTAATETAVQATKAACTICAKCKLAQGLQIGLARQSNNLTAGCTANEGAPCCVEECCKPKGC